MVQITVMLVSFILPHLHLNSAQLTEMSAIRFVEITVLQHLAKLTTSAVPLTIRVILAEVPEHFPVGQVAQP